jgi:hypothetical protein
MKNIHVLPTDKPSRLHITYRLDLYPNRVSRKPQGLCKNQHIYITSNEEIKEGDYGIIGEVIMNYSQMHKMWNMPQGKKIILTTDQDLIKDGVQAIDDEFLEWFVKNPSREYVNFTSHGNEKGTKDYELIIPKKVPNQTDEKGRPMTYWGGLAETNQENCCTPAGQIKRYVDCKGCDRKPNQETLEEVECNNCGYLMSLTEDESVYACYNSECTSCYEEYEEEPKQELEKELFELEQELDIPSSMRWHNSKPNQEPLEEDLKFPLIIENGMDYLNLTTKIFNNGANWQAERSQKIVPSDAYNIEVFAIKPDENGQLFAYIGYKISNGNFEFNVVPFTEPQERMYSEEDLKDAYFSAIKATGEGWNGEYAEGNSPNVEEKFMEDFNKWFEQFKKKQDE